MSAGETVEQGLVRNGPSEVAAQQNIRGEEFHVLIELPENEESDNQPEHRVAVAAQPVKIALGALCAHEHHDSRAAVQGRNWKQIESPEEQIELEKSREHIAGKVEVARNGIGEDPATCGANAQPDRRQKHKREIGGGTGEGHPGGAPWVTALPAGIKGGAGPADHAAGKYEREYGDHHHAPGLAADVRDGIESDLAAEGCRFVAAQFGNQGVGSFVASRGEKECNVPDETEDEKIGGELRHERDRVDAAELVCKAGALEATSTSSQTRGRESRGRQNRRPGKARVHAHRGRGFEIISRCEIRDSRRGQRKYRLSKSSRGEGGPWRTTHPCVAYELASLMSSRARLSAFLDSALASASGFSTRM